MHRSGSFSSNPSLSHPRLARLANTDDLFAVDDRVARKPKHDPQGPFYFPNGEVFRPRNAPLRRHRPPKIHPETHGPPPPHGPQPPAQPVYQPSHQPAYQGHPGYGQPAHGPLQLPVNTCGLSNFSVPGSPSVGPGGFPNAGFARQAPRSNSLASNSSAKSVTSTATSTAASAYMTRLHSFHNLKAKTRSDLTQLLRNARVDTNINIASLAPLANPPPQASRSLTPAYPYTVPVVHSRSHLLSNNKYPENSSNIVKSELSLYLDRGRHSALSDSKNSSLSSYNLNRSSSTTPQTLVTSEQQERDASEDYKDKEREFKDETPLPTCLSLESISEGATKTSTYIADSCRNPEASLESSLVHSSTSFASAEDGDEASDKGQSSVHEAHSANRFSAPNSPTAQTNTSFPTDAKESTPETQQSEFMSETKAVDPALPVSTHSAADRTVFTSDKESAKNASPTTSPEGSPKDFPKVSYKPYKSMLLDDQNASESRDSSGLKHQPSVQDLAVTISQNTNTSNETLAKTRPKPANIDTKRAQNLDEEVFTPCSEYSFAAGEEKLICKQDLQDQEDEHFMDAYTDETKPSIKRDASISNILDAYSEEPVHESVSKSDSHDAQDPQEPQEPLQESIQASVPETVIEKQEEANAPHCSEKPQPTQPAEHSVLTPEPVPEKSLPEASSNDDTLYHESPEIDASALESDTDTCKDQNSHMGHQVVDEHKDEPVVDTESVLELTPIKPVLAEEASEPEQDTPDVTEPVRDVTEPVKDTESIKDPEPVKDVTEPVKDVTEPVKGVTEPVKDTEPVRDVTEPVKDGEETVIDAPKAEEEPVTAPQESTSEEGENLEVSRLPEDGHLEATAPIAEVTKKPPPSALGDSPLRKLVAKELENRTEKSDNSLIKNRLSMLNVVNVDFDKSLPTTPDNMKFTVNMPDSVSPKKLISPQKPPMQRNNSMSKSFSINNFKKVFGRFGNDSSVKDSSELILSRKESFGSKLLKKKTSFSSESEPYSHANLSFSSLSTQKKGKRKFFKTLKFIPGNNVKEEITSPVYSVRSKVPSPTLETFSEETAPVNLYRLPDFETEDDGFLDLLLKFDEVEKKAELEDEQMRNQPKANAFFMRDDELTKAQIADQQRNDNHNSDESLPEKYDEANKDNAEENEEIDSQLNSPDIPWSPGYDDYASGFITPETDDGPKRVQSLKLNKTQLQDMLDKKAHSNHFIKHVRQMQDMDLVEIIVEAFNPNEKKEDELEEPKEMNSILKDSTINNGPSSKAVKFSSKVSISETYPSYVYRRYNKSVTQYYLTETGEVNKIKNELNAYKCYEMLVHEKSQNNTQFFY